MLREQNPGETIGFFCQRPFGQIIPPALQIKLIEMPPRAGFAQLLELARQIRKYRFDRVFDLFSNPATAIVTALSGIQQRYGFDYRVRRWVYHQTFTPPDPNKHLMQLFADFFAYFGVTGELEPPRISPSQALIDRAMAALPLKFRGVRPLLGINPHTTYQSKAWPDEYFCEFIRLWYAAVKQPVLITWGPGERDAAERLADKAGRDRTFVHENLRIDEFAALLSRLDLFLTCDTGPMNIAWAVDTSVVALFGPTTREPVYPRGDKHLVLYSDSVDCLQCHRETCSHKSCMVSLTPEKVFSAVSGKYGSCKGF
ncbi:MAG: Glycosyl transferase family 9 [uncultured bacterium]|nr:MAG: Glycosyl transferase family 9 [uncultured bacterium]